MTHGMRVVDLTNTVQSLTREEGLVPAPKGLAKRSEKGLLTPDNCAVAFIDHQPQMLFGTSYPDRQSIINKHHYRAYGIGVEYAYTMVHKAPASVFPEYVIPSPTSHR